MLALAEAQRHDVAGQTPRARKSAMGQFMTPATTARFMAAMFKKHKGPIRLLDPGAGLGALTCAMLDRWKAGALGDGSVSVVAHELDDRLRAHLAETLALYTGKQVVVEVRRGDFLEQAADALGKGAATFTHVILNPPYKKIGVDSDARHQAQRIGLTVVNLYAAFVGLALAQLEKGGQLVAIIPRSFCNGPYYKPFRRFLLDHGTLKHLHLFDSRSLAFKDDSVLQENVIMRWVKGGKQGAVKISFSTDDTFADLREETAPFASVVKPDDRDVFFHIPDGTKTGALEAASQLTSTLADLGLQVSTGPVVDFRMREHLRGMPTEATVPLLYPGHFKGADLVWPIQGFKKANAIERNEETERWLYPSGTYTVVRRFTSKEEKRRIVATVVPAEGLGNPGAIGFENHLNVFHMKKRPIPDTLAWGLFVYLNCSAVDEQFRQFNGHTQVNATDLRNIRYPTREALDALGQWALSAVRLDTTSLDRRMEALLS